MDDLAEINHIRTHTCPVCSVAVGAQSSVSSTFCRFAHLQALQRQCFAAILGCENGVCAKLGTVRQTYRLFLFSH